MTDALLSPFSVAIKVAPAAIMLLLHRKELSHCMLAVEWIACLKPISVALLRSRNSVQF